QLLERAASLTTYHPEQVYLDLGDLYLQKAQFRQAVAALQASIRIDPHDERPYYALAKAYRALGTANAAAAARAKFERISQMHMETQTQEARVFHNPANARARLALARVYRSNGMLPQSEEQYAAYLRLNPSDRTADRELRQLLDRAVGAREANNAVEFSAAPLP